MDSEPLDAVSLATRLRLLRTQLGLSQEQLSNKEIAVRLYLSPGTVERHLATIYHKLGVGGRVEATRYALEHELAGR